MEAAAECVLFRSPNLVAEFCSVVVAPLDSFSDPFGHVFVFSCEMSNGI